MELPGKRGPVNKQLQFACKELGPEGAAGIIQQSFGVTIDHWLLINMNALAELVDLAGGIEVFLNDLSINKKAGDLKYMVSKPWQKVQEAGLQKLNGVQMMAYISDTYYDKPTISEEEVRFRERHEVLIRGIIAGLRIAGTGYRWADLSCVCRLWEKFHDQLHAEYPAGTSACVPLPNAWRMNRSSCISRRQSPQSKLTTAGNPWGIHRRMPKLVRALTGR